MDLFERAFQTPEGILGRLGGWLMARANTDTIAWALDLLRLDPADRVLEVGFGPGVGIEMAARRVPEGFVGGVDPSPEMIEAARERNIDAIQSGHVEVRGGVAERLPWPEDSFGKAFSVNTFHLVEDRRAAVDELYRILSPGARLAIAFTARLSEASDGLSDELVRAGFHRPRRFSDDRGACVVAER